MRGRSDRRRHRALRPRPRAARGNGLSAARGTAATDRPPLRESQDTPAARRAPRRQDHRRSAPVQGSPRPDADRAGGSLDPDRLGLRRRAPPANRRAGLLEFIASVAPPDVMAAIREAEPLSEIVTHGFPANQRRRYDSLKRFPDGTARDRRCDRELQPALRAGDVGGGARGGRAAPTASTRGRGGWPSASSAPPARSWHRRGRWRSAETSPSRGGGDRPLTLRLTNAYVERLLRVAEHDPVVAAAFNEVADLLAPPQSIIRPRVLWRVLRGPRPRPRPRVEADGARSSHGRRSLTRDRSSRHAPINSRLRLTGVT